MAMYLARCFPLAAEVKSAFAVNEPLAFYFSFLLSSLLSFDPENETMGRPKKPRVAWNFDDECSMLAFLEFRISHGERDRVRNIEAITNYLGKKRSKKFTISQVEDKLNEFQNKTTRKRRRGTIFTDGLKALSSLPHEEHVLRLKQELDDEFVMNMHSQDRLTRSGSRSLGFSRSQRGKYASGSEIPESPPPSRLRSTRASRFHISTTKSTSPLARKSRVRDQVILASRFLGFMLLFVPLVADDILELSHRFKSHAKPKKRRRR